MRDLAYRLARRVHPGLHTFPPAERPAAAGYVIRILVFLPFSLIGLAWLIRRTDIAALRANGMFLAGLLAVMLALSQLWLQTYYVTAGGEYRSERRSFWGEAMWSGVLVVGPSAAWLGVILPALVLAARGLRGSRLHRLRVLSQSVFRTSVLLPTLIEVWLYEWLGGAFPLPGLTFRQALPAVIATLAGFSLGSLMIGGALSLTRMMSPPSAESNAPPRFLALATLIGPLAGLVAILPAGLHALAGSLAYFAFLAVMVAVAVLADQLSHSIEHARRRTEELERIEQLGRAIIQAPPDADILPGLLAAHVPAMFPGCRVAIRLRAIPSPVTCPPDWRGPDPAAWDWSPHLVEPRAFSPREARPWPERMRGGTLVVPIVQAQGRRAIGRIYLHSEEHGTAIRRLIPAAQSLAGQIASALHSAEAYRQTLAERVARQRADEELALGARIQASFLPPETPRLEGWGIAAALEPARETSGDFYDFIPLSEGRWGIVVADVADKGLGAAFYMALCCTLIRTYAAEQAFRHPRGYPRQVGELLRAVNGRLLCDSSMETFVTLFYGILDPRAATLTYANAGHNPPLLFRRDRRRRARALMPTGPALGLLEETRWARRGVTVEPGDVLAFYTDGLTEAEAPDREPFGEARLQQVIRDHLGLPIHALCDAVLASAYDFTAGAPRFDDLTLILLRREASPRP